MHPAVLTCPGSSLRSADCRLLLFALHFSMAVGLAGAVGSKADLPHAVPDSTRVSNVSEFVAALADRSKPRIELEAGWYMLGGKQLDVARGVVIVALGEVVIDAQGYSRALRISPNQTEHVELFGLNITGGVSNDAVSPSPGQPASQPAPCFRSA